MAYAIERGINFFDTAELYGTYDHIRYAMKKTGRFDIVISTKTYAYTHELAVKAVEGARKALDRDVIDIFMLHEQESIHTCAGTPRRSTPSMTTRPRGSSGRSAPSTHRVAGVEGGHPTGAGYPPSAAQCRRAGHLGRQPRRNGGGCPAGRIQPAFGVFTMKALGGGNLFRRAEEAFATSWISTAPMRWPSACSISPRWTPICASSRMDAS